MTESNYIILRKLTEKYLNGSITSAEMEILRERARGNELLPDDLRDDVEMILALDRLEDPLLSALEKRMPDDMEERLSAHISRLAAADRVEARRPIWSRRILRHAGGWAAAACAGIAITVGIIHDKSVSHRPEGIASEYSQGVMEEIENGTPANLIASAEEINVIPSPPEETISKPEVKATAKARRSDGERRKSVKKLTGEGENLIDGHNLPETSVAVNVSVTIPDFISPLSDVMPIIAQASINTSDIVVLPFSTLNQSFDNVFEAIETVSTAISLRDAMEIVTDEVGKLRI